MYNKSTYTFGLLKQNIYKELEEYSVNGEAVSLTQGVAADIEKRFLAALNMCARRIALSLPLLIKKADISFAAQGESCTAALPSDFAKVCTLRINGVGKISDTRYEVSGDTLICNAAKDGDTASLEYAVKINSFTPETGEDEEINLPDTTTDALVYLTAAELCPTDCSELYSRLMYKYREIAYNYYNADNALKSSRNTFYGRLRRRITGGR